MLKEYKRAREEAKMEIARTRDRLREQAEQEKLRIRQQIISQLLRVGNRFQGRPGACRQTSDWLVFTGLPQARDVTFDPWCQFKAMFTVFTCHSHQTSFCRWARVWEEAVLI